MSWSNHAYWEQRANGYSKVNQEELNGISRKLWKQFLHNEIQKNRKGNPQDITVLELGAGPGFLSIILAEQGYQVTATDFSEAMIQEAMCNAKEWKHQIRFIRQDVMDLQLEENAYDVILCRNLTWNLMEPEKAYAHWHRFLKPGGFLMIFDANWYGYLFDEQQKKAYELDRKNVKEEQLEDYNIGENFSQMEEYAKLLPLSSQVRPGWDFEKLNQLGYDAVFVQEDVGEFLYTRKEKMNYHSTPLFYIRARKENLDLKQRIHNYWNHRADTFYMQRKKELESDKATQWLKEIEAFLPKREVKILDVGCGAGFFEVLLGRQGYSVTGIDLSEQMVMYGNLLIQDAGLDQQKVSVQVMDAMHPQFEKESFDIIITRNLTWTLPGMEEAYCSWKNLLKKGGSILNFDAEYSKNEKLLFDVKNQAHQILSNEQKEECGQLYQLLESSKKDRPQWDEEILKGLGFQVEVDPLFYQRMFAQMDEYYIPDHMFFIHAKLTI